jgi:hypothetical protein
MKTCLAVVASLFLLSCGSGEEPPSSDIVRHRVTPIPRVNIDTTPPLDAGTAVDADGSE